ncbi:transposable element Tc3 transposase [Trichonephila clavipes]|nr:transposable element Tc3 transposase [Trichonephila clavipes]
MAVYRSPLTVTLWPSSFLKKWSTSPKRTPNTIQPEVRFITKQNSLMKIENNGNLVLGPFDESTPGLMIVLMNCQPKLRKNHLTAVKSVPILENSDRFYSCQVIFSQFGLAIHENDPQARRRFAEWAQNEIAVVPDFHKRILFSEEAHFWLNGYVNKQKCCIWSEANPQVYVETPLHPGKLTVWCALWAGVIIGPYFFKNDEGHNVTVNGDRCRAMITSFFIPELNNHAVQELWFQQEGATCHTARATIDLLKDTFGDRLILRFGL